MATFSLGTFNAAAYRLKRPSYTPQLVQKILGYAHPIRTAMDVATGNGQLAYMLAQRIDTVYASDPSQQMLSHAKQAPNIHYSVGHAEHLDQSDSSLDLVTVAQGAHWFKRDAFLREAHRVLKPTGTLALFGYGFIEFPTQPTVTSLIREYADGLLGPYWEPGRLIVDRMYRDWSFGPYFDRVERHEHRMEGVWSVFPDAERLHTDEVIESGDYLMDATEMSLNHLKHYLGTWSAYKRYLDAHPTATDPLDDCLTQISQQTNIHDWNAPLAITFPHVLILASNSKP